MKPEIKKVIDSGFPDYTEEYTKLLLDRFNNPDKEKQEKGKIGPVIEAIREEGYFNKVCQGILENEERKNG